MNRRVRGFSVLELLLALTLGLVLSLGFSQIAISARTTDASQQAAMLLQDDARFALGKLIQDIRLAGMFGCLATASIEGAPLAFDRPISWSATGDARSLTLVSAEVGEDGGAQAFKLGRVVRQRLAQALEGLVMLACLVRGLTVGAQLPDFAHVGISRTGRRPPAPSVL